MGDYFIRMRFDVEADAESVRAALTSREGIAGWWSDDVAGSPGRDGGELLVGFPDLDERFHFAVGIGSRQITWETLDFPPWWAGTTIRWELQEPDEGPGTRLLFTHEGFDPDNEVIAVITLAWAEIVGRLRTYAETGAADPFARG